jgi:hypothetical protein
MIPAFGKVERKMSIRVKKSHPALKHAGYCATSVLPGENAAEFKKLHRDLIAELTPSGALEDDIVATMAGLLWRKQNLATFRIAQLARNRSGQIRSETVPPEYPSHPPFIDPAVRQKAIRAAEDQAREELGDTYELVEIGAPATTDRLMEELDVQDRLDAMIDKCLKRLLFVRGLKSISADSSSTPPKRLAEPSKAA